MLAIQAVAHENHGLAVVNATFGLPGAFKRTEALPMMLALPSVKAFVVTSLGLFSLRAILSEDDENAAVMIGAANDKLKQVVK